MNKINSYIFIFINIIDNNIKFFNKIKDKMTYFFYL